MPRYIGKLIVEFTDGTTVDITSNRHATVDGVLRVWSENSYGNVSGKRYFPLANVKSFYWEGE